MPMTPNVIETTDAVAGTATTYVLGIGQSAQGVLTLGDSDWYAVTLVAGQTYTIAEIGENATTLRAHDTYLNLRNSAGTILASSDDVDNAAGFLNSTITFTATSSGTYYIDAGSYNGIDPGQYGLSITTGTRAFYDDYMGAGAILNGNSSWSATPGTGVVVTYGFRATAGTGGGAGFSHCTAAEMAVIRSILQEWSDVCGISFQEVNAGGYTDNATILIGNYNDPADGAGAYAYFPGLTTSTSSDGDIWLNLGGGIDPNAIPVGSYSYFAIMHEMGHMLGLDHPGPYNAAPGVDITYANAAMFIQDSQQRTVMSYFAESETGANFGGYTDTPMLFDILAAQQIYGANMTTRTGDTVYGFNSNTGKNAIYDAGTNSYLAFCVWDAGGTDTFDFSGYGQNQTISLVAGSFSSVGGLTSNVSIAYNVTVENAIGGSGADTITGNAAANTLSGSGGNDTISGGLGNDSIDGGAGTDTAIFSGARANYAFSMADATHTSVTDQRGGAGDGVDLLSGIEYVQFADGTFALSGLVGTSSQAINGTSGNDSLVGSQSADAMYGFAGNDTLNGGAGADSMYGGAGADTYIVDDVGDTIVELAGEGTDLVIASVTYALAAEVENLTLTGAGAIGGTGNALANVITGNAAANVISGSGGDDTISGGAGNDTIDGGAGTDTLVLSGPFSAYSFVVVDATTTRVTDQRAGGDGQDLLSGIEYVSFSDGTFALSAIAMTNVAGGGGLVLTGTSAKNRLVGGTGDDLLDGRAGADTMLGGLGNDTYIVDNAGDVVSETGAGIDTVKSSVTFSLSDGVHAIGSIENLTLTGTTAINATGNALGNILIGNSGNNTLAGLGGADRLDGGAGIDAATYAGSNAAVSVSLATGTGSGGHAQGDTLVNIENLTGSNYNDTLEGSSGANVLTGGAGTDTVSYEHASAAVTVSLATTKAQSTGGAGSDTLSGFENLIGSAFNDRLTGTSGNNTITGMAGNDTMTGGGGNDTFVFHIGFGHDTITDFSAGPAAGDVIEIDHALAANFQAILAATTDIGADLQITLGSDWIVLKNVASIASLNANDFHFV